ncbi:hypothetical protein B5F34_08760 [Mediterranea sp. An20]|uniref:sulfatase n=1 Tax=Mediterranea sp. An20 TaxID=1965586 RepID=UPI000B378FC0|nr:sulfatase [Mediterranea sp. An20]OUP08590.1 hypothetical protein B5F34_08760 [Mediterranea sp. An20]
MKKHLPVNLAVLSAIGCTLPVTAQEVKEERPNIILINIDDLGWTDLSGNGSGYYETPNIDKLREAGIWFPQAYAGAANSAPSRACMLTGQYAPRHGIYTVGSSERGKAAHRKLIPIPNHESLPDGFQILPRVLQEAGYQTFHVGKWHVTNDPTPCGIDKNIGGNHAGNPSTYFSPYHNANLSDGPEGEFLTDRLGREAAELIRKADRSRPFFLYYATYAVHTPLQAEPELIQKYKEKPATEAHHNPTYAALVEAMDRNVGRVWQAVQDNGLEDNTLIIFTSDNGGVYDISKQWPLRAGKGSFYEGGIRVPLVFYWKDVFEHRTYPDVAVSQLDIFPTLLTLTGISPDHLLLDGMDLTGLLRSGKDAKVSERVLYWHFPAYLEGGNVETTDRRFRTRPVSVIRQGEWKLIENYETGKYELYNVVNDISEREELSGTYPQKVEELSRVLDQWKEEVHAPVPTELNPDYKNP